MALGDLPAGWRAYVDADWVRAEHDDDVPAILADPAGTLRWRSTGATAFAPMPDGDPDLAASRALAWTAHRAVTALQDTEGVEVIGKGALSVGVRHILSRSPVPSVEEDFDPGRPSAVIVTEGSSAALVTATERVADLGTVVLLSELAEPFDLDLYPDIHTRGLTLVGIPGPLERDTDSEQHPLESLYQELLVRVHATEQLLLEPKAAWFCLSDQLAAA